MIHDKAIVSPEAIIHDEVEIGPYSVIGSRVEIGERTRLGPHVVINGPTRIGCDNHIYQFASLGEDPQDKKYEGERSSLEIGDRNTIREFCTVSRGTRLDADLTRIGDDNWVMAYCHIAHDCHVGSHTVFANGATLGGHVHVGDYAILGGYTGIHQFCQIGAHSFLGMFSAISKDVPAYIMTAGQPAKPRGSIPKACGDAIFPNARSAISKMPSVSFIGRGSNWPRRSSSWKHWWASKPSSSRCSIPYAPAPAVFCAERHCS